ncbi:MAG: NUDIX domain-containing protein [Gemmatimonadaceae bacterium]|jgi:8-oxo-dGTP pyrophosphatase MutT (NUDIX family)|nr:NUDIX domain-containing protein [Gemmatimonadaceae bacterium]
MKVVPVVRRWRGDTLEILAFRHPLAGLQLVKGTVEPGESLHAAAERELREEAGIDGRTATSLGDMWNDVTAQSWHFVLMDVPGALPDAWVHRALDDGGHDFAFFWLALDHVRADDWHAMYVRALEHLRQVTHIEALPERHCARLLIIDASDRTLLFRYADGRRPPFWATVGGQVLPGETVEATAARELREETGYRDAIGSLVRRRVEVFQAGDVPLSRWVEHYFVVRTAGGALDTTDWTEEERRTIREWRWWSVAELRARTEQLFPAWLPDELERLVAASTPDAPHGS